MSKFKELKAISDLKYGAVKRDLMAVVSEEQTLRQKLSDLNTHARAKENDASAMAMKLTAADLAWSAWLEQARSDCNLELAKVLARKERFLARARLSFGKVLVSDSLNTKDSEARRRKKAAHTIEEVMSSSLTHRIVTDR